jgi:hypothetical protein
MNIYNCKNGLYAEKANVKFNKPTYYGNISDIAVNLTKNTIAYAAGFSGPTGNTGSINIQGAGIGINVSRNSVLDTSWSRISGVRYGVVAAQNASVQVLNTPISRRSSISNNLETVGVYVDSLSIATLFDSSCSGFSGGTSPTGSSMIRCINQSVVVFESSEKAATVAVGLNANAGHVIVDTNRGKNLLDLSSSEVSFGGGISPGDGPGPL